MIQFGQVKDISQGRVKVYLPTDDFVTGWLPVVQPATNQDKAIAVPGIDSHVAVLLDENAEDGVCLGAIYDESNTPDTTSDGSVYAVDFRDGTKISYDASASELVVEGGAALSVLLKAGTSSVKIDSAGIELKRGVDTVASVLADLITQLTLETHGTAVGPTTPPLNAAAYSALQVRLAQILT